MWVKEYSYSVRNCEGDEKETYVLKFNKGKVEYIDTSTKVIVKKRRTGINVSRPSKVSCTRFIVVVV